MMLYEDQSVKEITNGNMAQYGATESADFDFLWRPSSSVCDSTRNDHVMGGDARRALIGEEMGTSHHSSCQSTRSLGDALLSAVGSSLSFPGKPCSVRDLGGTATIPNEIFNLVKNGCGVGILSIPMGIAAFSNEPSALIPTAILTFLMGAIFGYYFLLLGRVCDHSSAATYREAWEETVGAKGSTAVAFFNVLEPAISAVVYSMILGDSFQSLSVTAGVEMSRALSLFFVTIIVLLPLCLMKNLEALAPFSILGVASIIFTTCALAIRYFDHTYDSKRDGKFLNDIRDYYKPSIGGVGLHGTFSANVFVLVCMLYGAFVVHYNAPRFWMELKERSVTRFRTVVVSSFFVASVLQFLLPAFGFLTFGGASDGNILNNYSTNDKLMSISRVLISVAVITSYPLAFIGLRDGVLSILLIPAARQTSTNLNFLTVVLLTAVTAVAMYLENLGLVNAVGGGISAMFIVFIFPTLMFRSIIQDKGNSAATAERVEVHLAMAGMWLGIFMACIGTWMAIWDRKQ